MKKRTSLLGEEALWGGGGGKAGGEVWPTVDGEGGESSRRGPVEVRSTSFGGGYLRRLDPSEVAPLAEDATASNTLKKQTSASSIKALFERRPSLSSVLATSNSSNTSLSGSVSPSVSSIPRSLSFTTGLFSLSKRRPSPSPSASPSPLPSPSIDAFEFDRITESLLEQAKKNKRFF
ncbi:hypothetical protein BDY24DRAFT_445253 [Mrakia frigida]|uniref:uncharacterized protein n=1 Tax=Mrakia frigida TaxID=29902 RepID=UPI003FCBF6D5